MIVLDLNKQGENILDLTKQLPNLHRLRGGLRWDPHPVHGASVTNGFDLDFFIYCLTSNDKINDRDDVVFFNNKHHKSGGISVPVDNQTGDGDEDEHFIIEMAKLPLDRARFDIYVFIHEATKRGQNFGMVANASLDVIDDDTQVILARFNITTAFSNETALHVGSLIRTTDGRYEFHPIGAGAVADPNDVARAYL